MNKKYDLTEFTDKLVAALWWAVGANVVLLAILTAVVLYITS